MYSVRVSSQLLVQVQCFFIAVPILKIYTCLYTFSSYAAAIVMHMGKHAVFICKGRIIGMAMTWWLIRLSVI